MNKIFVGDCIEIMNSLEPGSVNCCVTSPPYWGLRDYGHDGQIGLEQTPEAYVAKMVDVFRAVRRVLRDDGTVWLNLGDSYVGPNNTNNGGNANFGSQPGRDVKSAKDTWSGLKPKNLVGIPWRVAFALQADGWYLRQDIIWHKPNPMPESVTDRCTKSHEYIFLLSKQAKYYYDNEAVKEDAMYDGRKDTVMKGSAKYENGYVPNTTAKTMAPRGHDRWQKDEAGNYGRNRRSVWTVATHPYSGAHFATFPPALITPCILAGCPAGGVVLDPFMGAGTTALVAATHGRQYIGCELNPEYAELAETRLQNEVGLLLLDNGAPGAEDLFGIAEEEQ